MLKQQSLSYPGAQGSPGQKGGRPATRSPDFRPLLSRQNTRHTACTLRQLHSSRISPRLSFLRASICIISYAANLFPPKKPLCRRLLRNLHPRDDFILRPVTASGSFNGQNLFDTNYADTQNTWAARCCFGGRGVGCSSHAAGGSRPVEQASLADGDDQLRHHGRCGPGRRRTSDADAPEACH
jgi:hypothetical protein